MIWDLRDRARVDAILNKLSAGTLSLSQAAQEFWSILSESSEQASDILEQVPTEILYKLIRAGLSSADPDMFRLGEKNVWFREKVGNVIGSLDKEELEEISKAILNSGLERSAIASRVFYRNKKLERI